MPSEDLVVKNTSLVLQGPLSMQELKDHFTEHSDLTYRTLRDLEIFDISVRQSLFTGSLIQQCRFSNVIFRRSDLDGIRTENTTFTNCDFSTCDIRSSVFSQCTFVNCSFDNSLLDDCEFTHCELAESNFKDALLSHCRFIDSKISTCNLSPGSFLHNKLYRSTLSDMVLGDCTFLYIILRDCVLIDIKINAESVGAIFGLTKEQLLDAGIIYLGKDEPVPSGTGLIDSIFEEYRNRKWWIGELVLAINFNLTSTIAAFERYLLLSFERFERLGFAKGDELEFLGDLINELADRDRLPILASFGILEWCNKLELALQKYNNPESATANSSLQTLASRTSFLTNTLLANLEESFAEHDLTKDCEICVKATFREKPDPGLTELLNKLGVVSDFDVEQPSKLFRAEKGSYVEIVYTTLLTVVAFQVFLFLINGCIVQLTELKHRVRVLSHKKEGQRNYQKIAISPTQQISPLILTAIHGLVKYASGLPWLKDVTMSGYAPPNIQSLQEVECKHPD